jgi:chromosome segregation ATPase
MNDDIKQAIESLQNLLQHNLDLNDLTEKHAALSADLESVSAELKSKKDELASATAGLSAAQVQAQREHEEAIHEKQVELKNLAERIRSAQSQLDAKNADLATAKAKHDEVLASWQSLRERFA